MKRLCLIVILVALAACSPAPTTTPSAETNTPMPTDVVSTRLIGCWRWDDGAESSLMRWTADGDHLSGDNTVSTGGGGVGHESYTLSALTGGLTLCDTSAGGAKCWPVTETEPRGEGQALVGGDQDHLKIVAPTDDGEITRFDGVRIACEAP